MFYTFRGRLSDGSTLNGTASGDTPVSAASDAVTQSGVDAKSIVKLTLIAITGANVSVRKPKAAKKDGATEADKAAGANHMASVQREKPATDRAGRNR